MQNFKLTNLISINFSHLSVIGLLFFLNIPNAFPADAPGTLASEPLHTSTTAKPNIMFIIDDSGSMGDTLGTSTRIQVAKDSAKTIIDGLGEVRVGLAKFDNGISFGGPYGATIIKNVADLTSSYKTELGTAIDDDITAYGWTPLASALSDIGRYFANGNTAAGVTADCGGAASSNLTIHPDNLTTDLPAKADVDCETLLGDSISAAGPVTAWCQKSFTILLTDGLATKDDTDIDSNLKDYDYDCSGSGTTPTDASGYTCETGADADDRKFDIAPIVGGTYLYEDPVLGSSDYLDDVAQALFEIDLQPALDDENGDEVINNLRTYVIGLADPALATNPLLKETARQGGGEFIYADSAESLVSAFNQITSSIIAQTSTSSAVTFNSSTLSSQSALYQALFNTARWSGELNSFPINGITGDINTTCMTDSPIPANCWKAADQLNAQTPSERFIITYGDTNQGVDFTYNAGSGDDYTSLSSDTDIPWSLVQDLCSTASGTDTAVPCTTSDSPAVAAANGAYITDLINYIRGENTNEGSTASRNFRVRTSDLGDIVNSSPVFVGVPQQSWPIGGKFPDFDASSSNISYGAWKNSSVKDRPGVVYVASNDGMLHGIRTKDATVTTGHINTTAGQEVFAYIPTGTFSTNNIEGLHYLADTTYGHRFVNDLSPTLADVYMNYKNADGTLSGTFNVATEAKASPYTEQWRTVLLGGQGGGGKSLYLLDVTDPLEYTDTTKQNAKKLILWEFSDSDADLGYTFSKPTIAMMNNGRFAAIFGNGYNSAGCKAKLFVVFLEGGLDGDWTDTGDFYEYDTGTAHGGGAGDCNGLSTPTVVDLDGNGTADRVYAGDLKGNMWVFDLCAEVNNGAGDCTATAANWGIAHTDPLMNANNGTVHDGSQPITSKPVVSLDPTNPGTDNLMIVFGTGQYLTNADKATTGLQRMYGVRDYDALNNTNAGVNNKWNLDGNDSSPLRWAVTTFAIDSGTGARVFSGTDAIADTDHGWRIDLPDTGERMVVNPKIRNNIVFFNTLIPEVQTCSYGGSGWIMSVNLINGGTPPSSVFDVTGNGIIDSGDLIDGEVAAGQKLNEIPAESTFLGDNQYTPGSDGSINKRKIDVGSSRQEGRMSWKEIYEAQ